MELIGIYKFIGKKGRFYETEQKLNSNCKQEEKQGTGPGSCGGSKSANAKDTEEQHFKESKDILSKIESVRGAKKRELENRSGSKKQSKESSMSTKSAKVEAKAKSKATPPKKSNPTKISLPKSLVSAVKSASDDAQNDFADAYDGDPDIEIDDERMTNNIAAAIDQVDETVGQELAMEFHKQYSDEYEAAWKDQIEMAKKMNDVFT